MPGRRGQQRARQPLETAARQRARPTARASLRDTTASAQAQERDARLLLGLEADEQHGGGAVEVRERDLQRATGDVVTEEGLLLGRVRAGAAVDVVGAERDAGELAVRVGVLEREPTTGQDGDADRGVARVVGLLRGPQAGRGDVERLDPAGRLELAVARCARAGCVMRSGADCHVNAKRSLSVIHSWLTVGSSPASRRSTTPRRWSMRMADPCESCSAMPGVETRSNGRDRNRYAALVRAPTGQICTVLPEKYDANGRPDVSSARGAQRGLADEAEHGRCRSVPICWLAPRFCRSMNDVARDLLGEPGAALAQDAALAVQQDLRRDRDRLRERALDVDEPGGRAAVAHRLVLQGALAALVAHRAVERVVDEQQLHDAVLGLVGLRRRVLRLDLHARRGLERAAGLGLGHLGQVAVAARVPRPRPGTGGRHRPARAAGGRRSAGSGCRAARRRG